MRKLLTLFTALLFVGSMCADEVTFAYGDYKGKGTSSSGSAYTMSDKADVSIGDTKFYGNNSYAHFYANGVSTITPASGVTITKVELTASAEGYNGYQSSGTVTASIGSVAKDSEDATIVRWTGSATSAFTISHNKQIRWTSIVVTYTKSAGNTCATPTFDPADGTKFSESQDVEISTTTQGATIYYTTDGTTPTTLSSVYSSAIHLTETTTIKAIAVKTDYNNSSVASATYTKAVLVYGYNVDFESDLDLYADWTFENLVKDNAITAHGGSYYAKTNGTNTASATTKEKVANPGTLTYYISKVGTNTNANSKWKARVSTDGTNWTIVGDENPAGAGVTQGTWNECTADLSDYSNVYVQVYYDGTSAVRTIDDISLTTLTKYNITVSDGIQNGSVTLSPNVTKATAGTEITLTATPDGGYLFEAWDVKDGENNPITVTNNKFNMPASNVTVSATFVLDECTPLAQPALDGDIALTCTSAVFTWEAVEHAEGYLLNIKQGSTSIVEDEMITDAVTYIATGLDAGTDYSYSLMALGDGSTYCFDNNTALEGNFSTPAQPVAPTFSVATGTYFKAQSVTITAEGATAIYYTLDGTDPTNESAEYEGAIAISETKTLKTIAEYTIGMSAIGTATYTILDIDVEGDGTKANPFTVADVYELNNQLAGTDKYWVIGYIVGCADNGGGKASSTTKSNIAIGSSADQTDNLVPVQLPSGTVRTALNIEDNAGNVGKYIKVYGTLESYFSTKGVKNTSDYEILDTPTAIDNTELDSKAVKVLRNGILLIEKNGHTYNAMGQLVK